MRLKIDISIKVSRYVKMFIFTDFLLLSGWGLIAPVFAVFIIQDFANATLFTVGSAMSIYWIVKSLIQLPVANYLDKKKDEKTGFYFLIISLFGSAVVAIMYTVISEVWHIYILQFTHALIMGLYIPAWSGLFSKHLDKKHMSLDWSLDSTVIGIAAGISGFIGGGLANLFGFDIVFILAAFFSVAAGVTMMLAPSLVFPPQKHDRTTIKDHTARHGAQR